MVGEKISKYLLGFEAFCRDGNGRLSNKKDEYHCNFNGKELIRCTMDAIKKGIVSNLKCRRMNEITSDTKVISSKIHNVQLYHANVFVDPHSDMIQIIMETIKTVKFSRTKDNLTKPKYVNKITFLPEQK